MSENESLEAWYRWAAENRSSLGSRNLPWEDPPWIEGSEEPLSVASILYALMEIRQSKSRQLKPGSSRAQSSSMLDPENWEIVDRPSDVAVRIIARALQSGRKGEDLIKKALELKPRTKGAILARTIARDLTKPRGGWPTTKEMLEPSYFDTVEWIKPSKQQVERELEERYPEIYKKIPKKDSNGGKVIRYDFWDDAGLKDVIDQARSY